jgi:hypothetical protein
MRIEAVRQAIEALPITPRVLRKFVATTTLSTKWNGCQSAARR